MAEWREVVPTTTTTSTTTVITTPACEWLNRAIHVLAEDTSFEWVFIIKGYG